MHSSGACLQAPFVREGAVSAFPFDAVIFDMDGVIVDTEYYYLGETAAFAKELGLNLTQGGAERAGRYLASVLSPHAGRLV